MIKSIDSQTLLNQYGIISLTHPSDFSWIHVFNKGTNHYVEITELVGGVSFTRFWTGTAPHLSSVGGRKFEWAKFWER